MKQPEVVAETPKKAVNQRKPEVKPVPPRSRVGLRIGMIAANHVNRMDPRSPARPVVAILAEADGKLLSHPEHFDFSLASRGSVLRTLPAERCKEVLGKRYPELC